jgi:tripartite-type tricarboxylate transporter receptor subunit TctC
MISRRRLLTLSATSVLAPYVVTGSAFGQAWPSRFVKLIVPFPPGGGTDGVGRVVAARLSEVWGQQVVIENRGGAGSNIGTEAAARSEPDGYTMLFSSLPHAINKFIYGTLPYDPVTDFAPITLLCTFPNIMAVPNSSPAKSVKEFIEHAKAQKGRLNFGSSGIGTSPHLSGELFKRMAGIEMTHVPYRGAGPALNDLIPGRLDMMFNTAGAMITQVRTGQIRGLAVTTPQRVPNVPELPTVAESGVPGYDVSPWYALFAPVKTPPDIVRKMNADVVIALKEPAVAKKMEDLGVIPVGSTPEHMAGFLKSEMDKWGPVIKSAGITAQ